MKEDNPQTKNIKGDNIREIIMCGILCDLTYSSS